MNPFNIKRKQECSVLQSNQNYQQSLDQGGPIVLFLMFVLLISVLIHLFGYAKTICPVAKTFPEKKISKIRSGNKFSFFIFNYFF